MKKTYRKEMLMVAMMILITILTQFASVIKSAVIASNFGAGTELDAYNFSNNLSVFFWAFITSGIMSILIPAYLQKKNKEAIDTFLTVVFSVTFFVLAVTFVFRDTITDVLTNRVDGFKYYVSNLLLFVMAIQGSTAVHGVTAAYFQCINKYNIPKIIQLFFNILSVIVLVYMNNFTIYQYVQVLLGISFLQLLVDIWVAFQYGFRFRPRVALKNIEFVEMLKLFVPTIFSTGIFQLHALIDSFIASNLQTGQLTILTYANTIINMVNALLIENIVVYLYPKLVTHIKKSVSQGIERLWGYIGFAHYALCLVGVGFVSCGGDFIAILYQNGKFDGSAVWGVYAGACLYMLGQPNNIIRDLIYRFFYASHDTKTTLYNSLLVSVANIVMSCIFARFWGVYGVIFGTVLAGALSLSMILVRFYKKFGLGSAFKSAAKEYIRTSVISVAAILCVFIIKRYIDTQSAGLNFVYHGCMSVVCFVLFSILFRSKVLKLYSFKE